MKNKKILAILMLSFTLVGCQTSKPNSNSQTTIVQNSELNKLQDKAKQYMTLAYRKENIIFNTEVNVKNADNKVSNVAKVLTTLDKKGNTLVVAKTDMVDQTLRTIEIKENDKLNMFTSIDGSNKWITDTVPAPPTENSIFNISTLTKHLELKEDNGIKTLIVTPKPEDYLNKEDVNEAIKPTIIFTLDKDNNIIKYETIALNTQTKETLSTIITDLKEYNGEDIKAPDKSSIVSIEEFEKNITGKIKEMKSGRTGND